MSKTYILVAGGRAIKCLVCEKTSHHPEDVKNLYCGFCHMSHELEEKRREIAQQTELARGSSSLKEGVFVKLARQILGEEPADRSERVRQEEVEPDPEIPFDSFLRDVYGIWTPPRRRRGKDGEISPARVPRIAPKVDFAFAVVRFAGDEVKIDPR